MAEVKSEQEEVEEGEEEVRTFLVVRAASQSDWGVYTCRADNNIANNEAAVVLKGDKNISHYLLTESLESLQPAQRNQRKKSKSSSKGRGEKSSVKTIFVTESSQNVDKNFDKTVDYDDLETGDDPDNKNKYSFFSSASTKSCLGLILITIHLLNLL